MVHELYGTIGNDILQDINKFAEERGGVLNLTSFTVYTMNHSMLLFPIFRIQRIIQQKTMGINYWRKVKTKKAAYFDKKENTFFNPRHVQILLRTYKTGAAAAILTHTGDPNVAIKEQFDHDNEEDIDNKQSTPVISYQGHRESFKYEKLKRVVEKIKEVNVAQRVVVSY